MTKRIPKASKPAAALPMDYAPLLADIKARVQVARVKAGLAANRELLELYWDIGRLIGEAQRAKGYGKRVVERLALDVQREFPGIAGFSPLNVWRMRAFYAAHVGTVEILSQPVTESRLKDSPTGIRELPGAIVQQPVAPLAKVSKSTPAAAGKKLSPAVTESSGPPEPFASLPWGHNLLLLHKLEKTEGRLWYVIKPVNRCPKHSRVSCPVWGKSKGSSRRPSQ